MLNNLCPSYSVGNNAYDDIEKVCSVYGKKAVIIGGKTALSVAEEEIKQAVKNTSIEIIDTIWYGGECSYENIDMIESQVTEADMLFAVGGGKAVDTVKVLAHRINKPFFTFPTIASNCAACTSLGIVYNPDGSLNSYSFSKVTPNHIFINTKIIAQAPKVYLWAGIGDTLAKHYECTISSRGDCPAHNDAMGIALSSMCSEPVVRYGEKAMQDCNNNKETDEFTEVILAIIVSTGYVSNFVQVDYTTGLAHAIYNGFTVLETTEKYNHLHGEIVAYGVLVMLTVDGQYEERDNLYKFCKAIKLPVCLKDLHTDINQMEKVAKKALLGIDVRKWPYKVTEKTIIDGIIKLEGINQ